MASLSPLGVSGQWLLDDSGGQTKAQGEFVVPGLHEKSDQYLTGPERPDMGTQAQSPVAADENLLPNASGNHFFFILQFRHQHISGQKQTRH